MNAQPMGFYPPSSLVRDAQRRGVEVRAAARQPLGGAVHDRRGRGAGRARLRAVGRRGRCESDRRAAAVRRSRRARAARVGEAGRPRGARRRRCVRRLGAAARTALAARRHFARCVGHRWQPPARAAPRADGRDARAAGADAVGEDARRLQAHVALGRRPPAAASAPASRRKRVRSSATWRQHRTARGSKSPGWRSRASVLRPRTGSSSCCSRTSTARRT